MTIFGDTKEEDREIFDALKANAKRRRKKRQDNATGRLQDVASTIRGPVNVDASGTWNLTVAGIKVQYWPTKGRWGWYDAVVKKNKTTGGGIEKFLEWCQKRTRIQT